MSTTLTSPTSTSGITYKITPEEMWNAIKGTGTNFGIPGYNAPRKYLDVHQIKWEKERARIKAEHHPMWPPRDWPKTKEGSQVMPIRTSFIDESIKLANSFNDPVKSKERYEQLAPKGIFNPPKTKDPINVRDKYLEEEKKEAERKNALPKSYEWKVSAIERAEAKRLEDEKNKKTPRELALQRYTKEKPLWPRCDRVSVMADAEYVGEQIPFYDTHAKEGDKIEKLFFPSKEKFMTRAPCWSFDNKKRLIGMNDQMKAREAMFTEKANSLITSKNLKPDDLLIDIERSQKLMSRRGHYPLTIAKSYDFANEEHYKKAREEHPEYSPGPQEYWQMKPGTLDINVKPGAPGSTTVNGKEKKIYYLNRRRTDNVISKPMKKSVF